MKRIYLLLLFLLALPAWGVVTTQTYSVSYTCTGGTGPFAFTFPISAPATLVVTMNGSVVNSANYSMVPINNNYTNGGQVTLSGGNPCQSGWHLILSRDTPLTQSTMYYDNMPTPMKSFENSLDKLTEMIQELNGDTVHSIQFQSMGANIDGPMVGDGTLDFADCLVSGASNAFRVNCSGVPPPTSQVYDIRNFGALCDWNGSTGTDNTSAIQAAVNAALADSSISYGVVWIPPGCPAWFGSTVTIDATTNSQVFIRGAGAKVHSDLGGSGLYYGGTSGPAFLVEASGSTANYTYFASFEDFYLGATAAAPALIQAWNMEGPAGIRRMTLDGGEKAVVGVKCYNCQFQVSGGDDTWIHGFTTYGLQFNAGGPVKIDNAQIYDIGQDSTGVVGSGIYAAGVNELNISHTYTELMANSVEITNGAGTADENYGDYNIENNYFNNWGSGSTGSPTNTVHQRCLLLHSTAASYPIFTQGRIVGNSCHLGPVFTQGLSLYAFEFDTTSNAFRKINNYTFADNQVSGMTTAAVYADDASTSVTYRNNVVTTIYEVGSSAPVYLPTVAGSGTYSLTVADTNGVVTLGSPAAATSGTTGSSDVLQFPTTYWTGSASANGNWRIGASEAVGANPSGQLGYFYTGSSGLHVVGFPGITNDSLSCTVAAGGFLHMCKTDTIKWRNNANSGDNALAVDGSDQLTYNGTVLSTGGSLSYTPHQLGLLCNDTDETTAINTAMSTLQALGGGNVYMQNGDKCRADSTINWGVGVNWYGTGIEQSGLWGSFPDASSYFDLRCSSGTACIYMTGKGYGSMHNLALRNKSTCYPFIFQTKMVADLDISINGSQGSESTDNACNDGIIAGLKQNTCASDTNCYFLGYGSTYNVHTNMIRIPLVGNTIQWTTGTFWGSSTDSNSTVDVDGTGLGPFIELYGNSGSSYYAIQNIFTIYGELGNAATHTGAGNQHYSSIAKEDYAADNHITAIGDDSTTDNPATAIFVVTANSGAEDNKCLYRTTSGPSVPCFSDANEGSYQDSYDDIPGSASYRRYYYGVHAGTIASPFNDGFFAVGIGAGVNTDNDNQGKKAASGGTMTYTFGGTYAHPPTCVVQDDTAFANLTGKTVTNTTLTVTTTGATDSVSWICWPRS